MGEKLDTVVLNKYECGSINRMVIDLEKMKYPDKDLFVHFIRHKSHMVYHVLPDLGGEKSATKDPRIKCTLVSTKIHRPEIF